MRFKLFTHTDLDGVGCAVVAMNTEHSVDVEYCDYDYINKAVKEFVETKDYECYNHVFITDISVNSEVAELIDRIPTTENNFYLIDHHATAEWLNRYPWASVNSTEKLNIYHGPRDSIGIKSSGTSLFHAYLLEKGLLKTDFRLCEFVETVRRYDTWEWKTIYNSEFGPKELNDLLSIIGCDRFVKRFSANPWPMFDNTELLLLELEAEKIQRYIDTKERHIISRKIDGFYAGVVFAEQYISQLGNELAERHPEYDFIVIINAGTATVSYRGMKDIHLGEFAKRYKGGGHRQSAGSPISYYDLYKIINMIFNSSEDRCEESR
jgi:oligoribonuclease NrnB/cAMP/cGMP phosphodiesterase (DHH superfamily)